MSGIYIKGMEMPKEGCHHIICIYADGTVATGGKTYRAVPVPDHGRLVDADVLIEAIVNTPSSVQNKNIPLVNQYDGAAFRQIEILGMIDAAPAIVPAEEDEA